MDKNTKKIKVLNIVPRSKNGKGFGFLNDDYFYLQSITSKILYIGAKSKYGILKRLFKIIQISSKYDIVHFEFSGFYLIAAPFFSKKTKIIYSIRGSDIQGNSSESTLKKFIRWVLFQVLGGFPNGYISVSDNLKNKLPKRIQSECIVIPTPLGKKFTRSINKDEIKIGSKKIGVVCGIPPGSKNEDQCLKAIDIINKSKFIEIKYILLNGAISFRDMPQTLRDLDLVISASVSEGSPNIIREAISVGTPVVCHDCGDTLQRFALMSGVLIVPRGTEFIVNGIINTLLPKFTSSEKFLNEFDLMYVSLKRVNFYKHILSFK